ncbi:LysM peptidoglycan-binding domain-containing protein [Stakelama marina]|uniref:LysM peptidoglycan-binding domain-containing protein n=1 Tax=Stakelama marina TaxID=2826939 RepID=A0A8T4IFI5_9SPHN|nr:LysM peptidoglycan-binding domain-containing protein [Stakelama marina]MBR0553323.1 LysM peptidoglycan-binding domain-containing protein [Stakelama marina]
MSVHRGSGVRAAWIAMLAGTALAGCSHGGNIAPKTAAPSAPAMVQAISNDLQVGDVIDALNRGDEKTARKKLKAMLKRDPGDARAQTLMQSIEGDPKAMLGEQSFAYTLRPGDTFPDLAKRYLGDTDKFYALARYNGIDTPEAAKTGTAIRIPGTEPQAAPRPKRVDRPEPKPAPAQPRPEPKAEPAPAKPSADPARAARYRSAGLAALSQGKVDRAVALLTRAAALDPGNALIKRDLARAQRVRRAVRARQ